MADLRRRRGLTYKFKTWPKMCFGDGFDVDRTPAETFFAAPTAKAELASALKLRRQLRRAPWWN
jgi:hypothetical protein